MKGHTNLSHFGQHSSAVVLSLVVAAIALVTTLVGDEAIATSVTEMLIRMTLVVGLTSSLVTQGSLHSVTSRSPA
ncbi:MULTISPECIES: hypothetical protein [unclassified Rhizobium]|uniref:hypothetical protein n=1 Tax=unclassified Rhizobium TaxID=2613769 RepID=UPI001FEFF3AE|nr:MULTISPECIES: hypothetical protein [unclassified Rhizobium]